MGQTTEQIKREIEQQRQELGSDLQQLESKVKNTMDWRQQYEQRPMAGVGIAFGAGLLLGMMAGGGSDSKQQRSHHQTTPTYASSHRPSEQHHTQTNQQPSPERKEISETMDNIRGAVMGIAAERMRQFLAETIPGFTEEYEEARKKRGASEATKIHTQHTAQSDQAQSWTHSQSGTSSSSTSAPAS